MYSLLGWMNSHGLETVGLYILFLLIAGTVPPLPDNAGFFATWIYLIIKAASINGHSIGNALGIKVPELQLANIPGIRTKSIDSNQTTKEGPSIP